MQVDRPLTFLPLTGIYEPSAIQQLADGRFLLVEDEKNHPLSLLAIDSDGEVSVTPVRPGMFEADDGFWKLDDLEGMVLDRTGHIYAMTSHSRDGEGDEKPSREKLVRFRIDGQRVVAPQVVKGLKPALLKAHPVLALIGFRSPLLDGRAILASVDNPAEMFDADAPPRVAASLTTLDLGGEGIRAMAHIPALGGYLISSGPAGRAPVPFKLWFWSGCPDAAARRVAVPGLAGFERTEGISSALIDGRPGIIVVSDDGNRKEGCAAHYLLLEPGQLQIAP
ncbi:MAG: hypothetical protein B7X81_00105 [Hydrogenophilales bacterium 17-61-76]|nr:MAG: hypothetical protein B7X81_00105 [Hydrogenophilales bacterium 17-61-76]